MGFSKGRQAELDPGPYTAPYSLTQQPIVKPGSEPKPHTAHVFVVVPERGDLYLVVFDDRPAQFIQLTEGGIVNDPEKVVNTRMRVLCDSNGVVVALPDEATARWMPCQLMSVHIPGTLP